MKVLDAIGVPSAGQVMNIVVFVALLSALNANLYGSSRMVFSLAERGEAPRGLLKVSGGGADGSSGHGGRGAAAGGAGRRWPSASSPSCSNPARGPTPSSSTCSTPSARSSCFVWALIAASQLRLRARLEREAPGALALRMWWFPYLTWLTLAGLLGVLLLMLTDADGPAAGAVVGGGDGAGAAGRGGASSGGTAGGSPGSERPGALGPSPGR
ncbi:GABA permease [Streptomyces cyaneofuscatus]